MNNRCNICLDDCNRKNICDCSKCDKIGKCPKLLIPTIRITNKCTQECPHCCFSSSPKSNIIMSVDTSKSISKFIKSNNILSSNVMGGEFFCNPNWYNILSEIISNLTVMRLVSNGDWINSEEVKRKFREFISENKDKLIISISNDKWHNNKNVDKVDKFLKDIGVKYNVADYSEQTDKTIVPIGRSEYKYSFYSSLGCYCHNPEKKYSFLIDENGEIYKCSFGMIKYANISEYLEGGFDKRFREFNKRFYSIFIPNCASCVRSVKSNKKFKYVRND